MAWDLREPECLTIARLMVAPPEFVYAQLKFYGADSVHLLDRKHKLEHALMGRNDKLINLGLAQFATNKDIIETLFNRANVPPNVGQPQENYDLGIRVACLSNRQFAPSRWPDFQLASLLPRGGYDEIRALLTNPSVPELLLQDLYKKSGVFKNIDEKAWLGMVSISAWNERLNLDLSVPDVDPRLWPFDMEIGQIHQAISEFLQNVTLSRDSVWALCELLGKLQPEHTRRFEISDVLRRWGSADLKDSGGVDMLGSFTKLTMKDELRCLFAALYGRGGGSRDDTDVALRCAFYAWHNISDEEIKTAFSKDGDVFLFSVLRNQDILFVKSKRALIEGYLSGRRDLISAYNRRCKYLSKSRRAPHPRPGFEDGRDLLEAVHQLGEKESSWIGKLTEQNQKFERRIRGLERRAIWIALIVVGAIYWIVRG